MEYHSVQYYYHKQYHARYRALPKTNKCRQNTDTPGIQLSDQHNDDLPWQSNDETDWCARRNDKTMTNGYDSWRFMLHHGLDILCDVWYVFFYALFWHLMCTYLHTIFHIGVMDRQGICITTFSKFGLASEYVSSIFLSS